MLKTLTKASYNGYNWGNLAFEYDYNGMRTKKIRTDGQFGYVDNYYYWQGSRLLAENHGGTLLWFYYDETGISGMNKNGVDYYFEKNILGDVVGIWNANGSLEGTYSYDAWGNTTAYLANGQIATPGDHTVNWNPFRYRGYYQDQETGFYYLQSRYYDPTIGRFINSDNPTMLFKTATLPFGANLFAYCSNNPVMYTDSTGTNWWTDFWDSTAGAVTKIVISVAITAVLVVAGVMTCNPLLVGAALGAGIGLITSLVSAANGGHSLNDFANNLLKNTIVGAVSGALGATGAGLGAQIGFNMLLSVGSYLVFTPIEKMTLSGFGLALVSGAAAGLATKIPGISSAILGGWADIFWNWLDDTLSKKGGMRLYYV